MKFVSYFLAVIIIAGVAFLLFGPNNTSTMTDPLTHSIDGESVTPAIEVPRQLLRNFPNTDWSKADKSLEQALSGGPAKDGIPAIDEPTFIPLSNFEGSSDIQTIVLEDGDSRKVYPYNILTWHEIVNDTVGETPVAITFCPLCGSAIVFDRTLPDGKVSTFGVSGSLLESNMIMYDRETESLWQQSTGEALAGTHHEAKLAHVGFQFMTLGEVREGFPNAQILSEDTGYRRDYRRNPYAGYETNNQFVFEPSNIDTTFNPKAIMVVFDLDGTPIVADWDTLRENKSLTGSVGEKAITYRVGENSELTITDDAGTMYPFYFEMWFSVAAQHGNEVVVIQ